ncbi:hypothetical protein ACFQ1L_42315 [Phytohabitans flavus]|nr:hypothetical protein [Phytohabitans flavus]
MIVPEVASGAAPELDPLRAACDAAVRRLAESGARSLLVVGNNSSTVDYNFPVRASFARWGLPEPPGEPPSLPLSLSVGEWLINRAFVPIPAVHRRFVAIGDGTPVDECAAFARRIEPEGPWALLAMGDGSACRGIGAPGYDDPRALPYDEAVERALASADLDALTSLDPVLSAELMVSGRAPWQVLAAAAAGGTWRATMEYSGAPYGVAYFVASWEREL